MKRRLNTLDIKTTHEVSEDDEVKDNDSDEDLKPKRSAAENKKRFTDSFGIHFKIPTLHVLDSKIFPKNPSYQIQLLKYVLPQLEQF